MIEEYNFPKLTYEAGYHFAYAIIKSKEGEFLFGKYIEDNDVHGRNLKLSLLGDRHNKEDISQVCILERIVKEDKFLNSPDILSIRN